MAETEKASDVQAKLGEIFTSGCTALGVALGAELGLFQLMSKFTGQFTSQELADAGGFKERYVREWLGQMVCAQMIELDPDSEKFYLLPEKAESLTGVIPVFMGVLPVFGQRHEGIKNCFQLDGPNGLDISHTPTVGSWLERYRDYQTGRLDELLTGKSCVPGLKEKLENGITVADIGCGTGKLAIQFAEKFPNSFVWASDIDDTLFKVGEAGATKKKLSNIRFEVADAHKPPDDWTEKFDYVLCYDLIHDLPWPGRALREMRRIMKDDGSLSLVEPRMNSSLKDNIDLGDLASGNYAFSVYWCMAASLAVEGSEGWGAAMGQENVTRIVEEAGLSCLKPTVFLDEEYHFVCTK